MKVHRLLNFLLILGWVLPAVACAQGAGVEWEILNREAMDLYRQGNYPRAIKVARKALEVAEQNAGKDHPDVATELNNLAGLYYAQGDYAAAEPLVKRSLAIDEKALGPDHPYVATSLILLAVLYHKMGRDAEAEAVEQRLAKILAGKP